MIILRKIKKIIKENNNKKINRAALNEVNKLLEEKLKEIIKKAEKNADFSGRKIIKKEDIKDI